MDFKKLKNLVGLKLIKKIVAILFKISSHTIDFRPVNAPNLDSYILALWHAHQCCLYAVPNREKVNVMISNSRDGDIVAHATQTMGLKVIRGSKSQKAIQATILSSFRPVVDRPRMGEIFPRNPAIADPPIRSAPRLSSRSAGPFPHAKFAKFAKGAAAEPFRAVRRPRRPHCGLSAVLWFRNDEMKADGHG